jgi:hypothetical protein
MGEKAIKQKRKRHTPLESPPPQWGNKFNNFSPWRGAAFAVGRVIFSVSQMASIEIIKEI